VTLTATQDLEQKLDGDRDEKKLDSKGADLSPDIKSDNQEESAEEQTQSIDLHVSAGEERTMRLEEDTAGVCCDEKENRRA
jgi:hypothetical protein